MALLMNVFKHSVVSGVFFFLNSTVITMKKVYYANFCH